MLNKGSCRTESGFYRFYVYSVGAKLALFLKFDVIYLLDNPKKVCHRIDIYTLQFTVYKRDNVCLFRNQRIMS